MSIFRRGILRNITKKSLNSIYLEILSAVFEEAPEKESLAYIRSIPTGKYARRVWCLYELLTGKCLPIEDLTTANDVDLLEPDEYYTADPVRVRRQRVNANLLGDAKFSPIIRRTQRLADFEKRTFRANAGSSSRATPATFSDAH